LETITAPDLISQWFDPLQESSFRGCLGSARVRTSQP